MGIPGESMRWDAGRSLDAMRLLRALVDQAKAASGREVDEEVVGPTVIATSAVAMAAVIGGIAGGAVGGVFTLLGGALLRRHAGRPRGPRWGWRIRRGHGLWHRAERDESPRPKP